MTIELNYASGHGVKRAVQCLDANCRVLDGRASDVSTPVRAFARIEDCHRLYLLATKTIAAILLMLVGIAHAIAQEVTVFALRGDGTATVVIDRSVEKGGKAWITDGGRSGIRGVREARIGNEDLLQYLLRSGVRDIAITCSHQHDDHMGGLEDLISDPRIVSPQFQSILFVDNGIPPDKGLFKMFMDKWGSKKDRPSATYASAANHEVFGDTTMAGKSVRVSNFRYDPDKIGKDVHDRSVIMQYDLGGRPPRVVVDFDDASTALVKKWVTAGGHATVLIHPHHGSRYNSIDAILGRTEAIGLKDVIISVNRENRYRHPAPEVLLNLVRKLGPEHVFVTDSDLGENVVVDRQGTSDGNSPADHLGRLRSFVVAQRDRFEAKLRQATQTISGDNVRVAVARWNGKAQPKKGTKESSDDAYMRRTLEAIVLYEQILAIIDTHVAKGKDAIVGAYKPKRRPPPDGADPNRIPEDAPSGPSGGSGNFFDRERSLNPEQPTVKEAPTTGKNGRLAQNAGANATAKTATNSATASQSRFQKELSREKPGYGGVILGNSVGGEPLSNIEFLDTEAGVENAIPQVLVRSRWQNGDIDYVDITNAELWAAYNLVQPSNALRARYGNATIDSPGLVALNCSDLKCRVALHPAIAGTAYGWSAMWVDILGGASLKLWKEKGSAALPDVLRPIRWQDFNYESLQWFDEKATVSRSYASLTVQASLGPPNCLMRVRLANREHMFGQYDWVSRQWPAEQWSSACAEYPPLAAIDRLAKVVALLNSYRRATGRELPDLPKWIRPVWQATPNDYTFGPDPYFELMQRSPENGQRPLRN